MFTQQLAPDQVQQLIEVFRWIVVAVVIGIAFLAQYKTNKHVIGAFAQALDNMQHNPVALENAKAAGAGVPQEAYTKLYGMIDGVMGFSGSNTEVARLLKEVKETLELIDRDPGNDPKQDEDTAKARVDVNIDVKGPDNSVLGSGERAELAQT